MLDEPQRYAAMRRAQLAITIPGTNTLELALAGLPSLVLLPLHKPEMLPLEGLWHWLLMLPGAKALKQNFIRRLEPRIPTWPCPTSGWASGSSRSCGGFQPGRGGLCGPELLERAQEVRARLKRLEARPGADKLVEYVLARC